MGKKKGMTAAEKREAIWGWAFILPTMIGLIVLNFYPVIQTIYQSFCKTGDFGKGNVFIGLGNYTKLLADGEERLGHVHRNSLPRAESGPLRSRSP